MQELQLMDRQPCKKAMLILDKIRKMEIKSRRKSHVAENSAYLLKCVYITDN